MGFSDFIKKTANKIKEANKPENVEKRLKQQIKISKLKNELNKQKQKSRKTKALYIGDKKVY